MKIAIFSDSFFPLIDGVTVSIKNNMEILSKKNKVYFFIPSGTDNLKMENSSHIHLKSFSIKSYKEYKLRLPTFKKAFMELRKIKPDIVHIHSIFGIGLEGLIASKILKIPVVATSHTVFPEVASELDLKGIQKTKSFENITWKYMASFLNKCDAVITPSEAMKKDLVKRGIKKTIYSRSNGIETKKYPYYKRKKKEPVFLSLGRLVESKHIDVLLKAFKIAKDNGMEGKLWIVGGGPEKGNLKKFTEKNNLSESVKFFGFVGYEKTFDLYKKADVFLTASTIETEGITTLEAMSTGLPVIGVNKRATPFLIGKDCGFVAPVGNSKKIAEFMEVLAKDYKLREKLGKNANKKAKKYELKKANKELFKTYKEIIKKYKK